MRWKAAIGSALDDPGFDPSTLVHWRRRIAGSARPYRVNDAVKAVIGQTGILMGRRRAVDSTVLADAVATQDTVTQLIRAICRVAREVPGAAGQIAAVCTGHDYSRAGKPKIDWDDPAAKDALVSALVTDANALVAAFAGAELEEQAASPDQQGPDPPRRHLDPGHLNSQPGPPAATRAAARQPTGPRPAQNQPNRPGQPPRHL